MPFTKHIIEPINISQCPLPPGEPNELECLSNLTLANVIRQLSSLGQHAGRIFEELTHDALRLQARTQLMHQRIENLTLKCAQLDIQSEEVTLADFQARKQFRSSIKIDQQVVSRKSMPEAMRIMYNNADPPPSLDKLNPYRTDGKDCMKFYTDPEFFFNIWCNELMKDNETRKIEKKRRKTKGGEKLQQQIKLPPELSAVNSAHLLMQQQMKYDEAYYQQQLMILNQSKQSGALLSTPLQQQQQQHQQQSQYFNNNINNGANNNNNNNNHIIQSKAMFLNEFANNDPMMMLPPPPSTQQLLSSYEVYAEASSNKISNGNVRNSRITTVQQASLISSKSAMQHHQQQQQMSPTSNGNLNNERPVLPPPPIPNNQLSDLQQIQQQMIKKKLADINIGKQNINNGSGDQQIHQENHQNGVDLNNPDFLPPPPSPPLNETPKINYNLNIHHSNIVAATASVQIATTQQLMGKMSLNEKPHLDMTDSMFDMPLPPPPPIDLTEPNFNNNNNNNNNHHQQQQHMSPPSPITQNQHKQQVNFNSLPPPPPLPPLVESDTISSSSSNSMNNTLSKTNQNNSVIEETKVARNCYLDDITKRRYQLKSTQKDTNSISDDRGSAGGSTTKDGDTIQPFVNNSDVAAIIDFIRKFRPHVRDSSDDDEENSDWDE